MVTTFNKKTGQFSTSSSSGGSSASSGSKSTKSSSSAPAGSLTFTQNGQQYVATPTASTTAAQRDAATKSGWTPYSGSYNPSGPSVQGGQPLPKVGSVVDASRLGTVQGAPQYAPLPAPSLGTSLVAGMPSPQTASPVDTNTDITPTEQTPSLKDRIMGMFGQNVETLRGQDKARQKLEKQYGLNDNMQKLAELQGIIGQRTAGYMQQFQMAENKAIPTPFIVGEETQIQRTQAVEIGMLNAQAEALQGNIEVANDIIDRTMKYKFEPIQQENQMLLQMYNMAQNDMSESEKVEAQMKIEDKQRQDAKLQSAVTTGLKAAASGGATQQQMNAISNAKSEAEAYMLASPFMEKDGTTSGNKLTFSEVQKLGLPSSLVGKSESQIISDLNGSIPPMWFREKADKEESMNHTNEALATLWDDYRNAIINTEDSGTTQKATEYFTKQYGSAVSKDDIKALADRVNTYVLGGMSYEKAVQATIDEASQ